MNDKVRSGLILGLVALLAGFAGAIVALGAILLVQGRTPSGLAATRNRASPKPVPTQNSLPGPIPTPTLLRQKPISEPTATSIRTFGPYNLGAAGEAHAIREVDPGGLEAGTVGYTTSVNYLWGEPKG